MTFPGILFIRGRSEKLNLGYRIYRREKNMEYKKERKNWEFITQICWFPLQKRSLQRTQEKERREYKESFPLYKSVGQSAEI